VILINLLPYREARRHARKRAFFVGMLASAVAGLGLVVFGLSFVTQLTSQQEIRNEYLRAEIKKLEGQIKDIATLRVEIEALKARQRAIEDLQTDRNVPVHLLNELVRHAPDGLYLKSMVQSAGSVVLSGFAQSNERVSELLRNTSQNGVWVERPELIEIKAANLGTTARDSARVYEFSMRLKIRRPEADAAGAKAEKPKAS
jgi:type IV pilus assembly protein PilN